ncbi:pyridoxamine 5'-phosphate oxidase family protein [Pseudonocardia xinjiangensis]|uniref:pyridoxamine 5'-phosphate oxidase family protein n=1 Tax=Pseudonocardia xinjiangensis TaxID=75289 RepID=UPI003D8BFD64
MRVDDATTIRTIEQLDALYGEPIAAAVTMELDHVSEHYRAYVEASPFVVLATSGPEGLDCSPRGDPPGFVRVADPKTLLIPDRRGNNRVDSLRNIVRDPRVALVFLIPGIGTLLRVNGRAVLSTDPALRESFAMGERRDKLPASVIVVTVDAAYIQCPKALMRSKLWNSATQIPSSAVPSMGEMLEAITNGAVDCQAFDAAAPKRLEETMY